MSDTEQAALKAANKVANKAWESVANDVTGIHAAMVQDFQAHRHAIEKIRETGEDPRGLIVDGRPCGQLRKVYLRFDFEHEGEAKYVGEVIYVAYDVESNSCYKAWPQLDGEDDLISNDERMENLPDLIERHVKLSVAMVMLRSAGDVKDVTASVTLVDPNSYEPDVMIDFEDVEHDAMVDFDNVKSGEERPKRVAGTQSLEFYRDALEQARARKM
jgi:hypothetical protein